MSHTVTQSLDVEAMMSLAQASVGCQFRILRLEGKGAECVRLRSRGFCEDMEIRKLSGGRNMICTVCGTRMALSQELADCIRGELVA